MATKSRYVKVAITTDNRASLTGYKVLGDAMDVATGARQLFLERPEALALAERTASKPRAPRKVSTSRAVADVAAQQAVPQYAGPEVTR